jgi:cobalt transporter subunit CbtA
MTRPTTCATPPVFPVTKTMYTRILTSALFAGAAAGLIAALLQLVYVQPVLLHTELYESGQLVHFGADQASAAVSAQQDTGGFVPVRDGLSILFTMLTYTGFSLVLVAAMSLADRQGQAINARTGLLFGLAGFITFHLAPGAGLAPGVPGVAAADVVERQIWWSSTVVATGLALWLIAYGRNWTAWGVAIVLLAVPHLIGAPQPESFTGPAPTELGALFATRVYGVAMTGWVVMGCLAGYLWQRETKQVTAQAA